MDAPDRGTGRKSPETLCAGSQPEYKNAAAAVSGGAVRKPGARIMLVCFYYSTRDGDFNGIRQDLRFAGRGLRRAGPRRTAAERLWP